MPLYKQPKPIRFTPDNPVEMHFHDSDEIWVVMGGRATAHMIDRDGQASSFEIKEGGIWMVEAGVEHGCDPIGEILIFPFMGTLPEGGHPPGHYYMEKEGYLPTLVLRKDTPVRQEADNA